MLSAAEATKNSVAAINSGGTSDRERQVTGAAGRQVGPVGED